MPKVVAVVVAVVPKLPGGCAKGGGGCGEVVPKVVEVVPKVVEVVLKMLGGCSGGCAEVAWRFC